MTSPSTIQSIHDLPLDIPLVELVKVLDRVIPHRCYERSMTLEANIEYAGKRALVDTLLEHVRDTLQNQEQ